MKVYGVEEKDEQGCRKWQENLFDKLSSVGQFGECAKYALLSDRQISQLCKGLDSAVSNSPMIGQSNVWSDSAVSNCPMVGLCYVK